MQKIQLDHWLHADHSGKNVSPKLYVISCEDLSDYLLAVEYKHKLEPVHKDGEPMHFSSLEQVKDVLSRLGVDSVYLRLHNTDDECSALGESVPYHDIEMSLQTH
ncbi:DUF6482 family protein [Vibrio algarum]|uniref:DUF6482 family protein n=1 Tax=Vibrio algarum TaxID=3020714 RepID=A0ABT4YNM9_9VIBR|nr:DUF6482 family protein [Vibrio sp. KJ40-1]MDB1123055.1 DUF6482 family protein [Vibrio sp. KJ40-1]